METEIHDIQAILHLGRSNDRLTDTLYWILIYINFEAIHFSIESISISDTRITQGVPKKDQHLKCKRKLTEYVRVESEEERKAGESIQIPFKFQ